MARDFDGTGDFLRNTSYAGPSVPLTIACWFNPDDVASSQDIAAFCVATGAGSNQLFRLNLNGAGAGDPIRAVATSGATSGVASSSAGVNGAAGTWAHACAVFASSTSRTAYYNGGNAGSETTSVSPSPTRFCIGVAEFTPGAGNYFNGDIAEVGVWSTDLSAAEVAMLGAGYSPMLVRPQSLVFYAPMFGRGGAAGNEEDWSGGLVMTQNSSPAVTDHPRIIYPRRRSSIFVPSSGTPIYTLTSATYVPGSITATGVTPRIVRTKS